MRLFSSVSSHLQCALMDSSSDRRRVFSNLSGAVDDVDSVEDVCNSVICAFRALVLFCKRLWMEDAQEIQQKV